MIQAKSQALNPASCLVPLKIFQFKRFIKLVFYIFVARAPHTHTHITRRDPNATRASWLETTTMTTAMAMSGGYISIFLCHRNLTQKIFSIRYTFHENFAVCLFSLFLFSCSFFFFVFLFWPANRWQCFCLLPFCIQTILFDFAHAHTEISLLCFFLFFSFSFTLFFLGFNRSALRTFIAVLCADVSVSFETRALTEPTRLGAAIEMPKTCSTAR